MADESEELFQCARCLTDLRPGSGDFFRVSIEAVADPSPPDVSGAEATGDIRRRIEELLTQMQGLSEQEALDQVYRHLTLYLCGACFRGWIENPVA
jgi:hypothetical protein